MAIKIKQIEAQTTYEDRKNHKELYCWVRPDKNHGSAMDYTGWSENGTGKFPEECSLSKYNKDYTGITNGILMGAAVAPSKSGGMNGSYVSSTNLGFFTVNPYDYNRNVFKLLGVNIITLRKYSPAQIRHIRKIYKELHTGNDMIVGEYRPDAPKGNTDFVFMSDTYTSYFDRNNKLVEYPGVSGVPKNDGKFTKAKFITAIDLLGSSIADKQIQERKLEHSKAQEQVKLSKTNVSSYGGMARDFSRKVEILSEAKKFLTDISPAKAKILNEMLKVTTKDREAYKQEFLTHTKKYKDGLKLIKHGPPTKEDYSIGESGINKELNKIKQFIKNGFIERMEYDPVNGIKITFPPMEYKSSVFAGRYFLGRPVVIIHDPNFCPRGSSCGTIRFTLPSFVKGYAATDHFNNTNGPNMDTCDQGGQCLGGSGGTSYWTIFGPLIASRRFGELIPKLKQYILEHNVDSPNGHPNKESQYFEMDGDKITKSPANMLDDSFKVFVDKITKDKKYVEPEEAYFEEDEEESEEEGEDDGI